MKKYKIFPSIGIARVGGSTTDFFLCPEKNDSIGIEINENFQENELVNFKDNSGLIKRQGVRFYVYTVDEETNDVELVTETEIIWEVQLVNKKASVVREIDPNGEKPPSTPPTVPLPLKANWQELTIDSKKKTISGSNKEKIELSGTYKAQAVKLGDILTDSNGNLIVLGGHGLSASPSNSPVGPIGGVKSPGNNFYYNEDWYDDTSDGIITAKVKIDGSFIEVSPSWIIVAPPDYAPSVKGVVTLKDIVEEAQTDFQHFNKPTNFKIDILPIIRNFANHKWVTSDADYELNYTADEFSDSSSQNQNNREEIYGILLEIEDNLRKFKLTRLQKYHLKNYQTGNYILDGNNPNTKPEQLSIIALQTTIGQGFFPGIEGGKILENSSIYSDPYRINHNVVNAGDITGLMAVPWQADFLECQSGWWPTQRPDDIISNNSKKKWARANGQPLDSRKDHDIVVREFNKFGFIKKDGQRQIEKERDPNF